MLQAVEADKIYNHECGPLENAPPSIAMLADILSTSCSIALSKTKYNLVP